MSMSIFNITTMFIIKVFGKIANLNQPSFQNENVPMCSSRTLYFHGILLLK